METLKKIFLAIVIIIVLLVIVAFFLPMTYHVERGTVIKGSITNPDTLRVLEEYFAVK